MNQIQINKYIRSSENLKKIEQICRDFEYFEYYLEYFTDDYYSVYVALKENEMVGVIVFCRHSFCLHGDFLWVDSDFRNQHIGLQLLEFFENYAKNNDYRAILGETLSTNEGGRRFYEKHGAEKYGEYDNLYGEGTELIIMYRKKFPENMELN